MKTLNLSFKVMTIFAITILLVAITAWLVGETTSLALTNISNMPVKHLSSEIYNDTVYATLGGERGGIFYSDDDGRSWQKLTNGPSVNINTVEIHPSNPDILFAGTAGGFNPNIGSLWYSNNRGQSWQPYTLNLPANPEGRLPTITALTVDPNHPEMLYVGTEGQGLYRVQSGYAGFQRVGNYLTSHLYVRDIVAQPNSPIYAITTEGLLIVEGEKWQEIATLPDAPVSLAVDSENSEILYVGTVSYGLHRSTDGGQTWRALNNGLTWQPGLILRIPAITVDKNNSQHLALAAAFSIGDRLIGDGIYESFDGGQHWVKIAQEQRIVEQLVIDEIGGIYAGTESGLTRYGDPLPPATPGSWQWFKSLVS